MKLSFPHFLIVASALFTAMPAFSQTQIIVNDSFADGDLTQTGTLDTSWWTSSSSSGIEISAGSLGLVTGTSGRGIHTVFPQQTLANVGDELAVTYTFTTPDTIRQDPGSSSAFRIGLFNSLGRTGLNDNVSASSSSPNNLYGLVDDGIIGLPGFMQDLDINTGAEADINFRAHDVNMATGRLLATTGSGSFPSLSSGPDEGYSFLPNTEYTGSFSIALTSASEFTLTGTLNDASFSLPNVEVQSTSLDLLAFHVNSNIFGSSNSGGEPDNGIDFSNISINFTPAVPEPNALPLLLIGLVGLLSIRKSR